MKNLVRFTKGVHLPRFTTIGGTHLFQPPFYTLVQTDGSFYTKSKYSRVALILTTADTQEQYRKMFAIQDTVSSTETEWASVYHGLHLALEKAQPIVALENDNLSVISGLILQNPLKHEYARYYKSKILTMTKQTAWTGIRWIPREKNRADALF